MHRHLISTLLDVLLNRYLMFLVLFSVTLWYETQDMMTISSYKDGITSLIRIKIALDIRVPLLITVIRVHDSPWQSLTRDNDHLIVNDVYDLIVWQIFRDAGCYRAVEICTLCLDNQFKMHMNINEYDDPQTLNPFFIISQRYRCDDLLFFLKTLGIFLLY